MVRSELKEPVRFRKVYKKLVIGFLFILAISLSLTYSRDRCSEIKLFFSDGMPERRRDGCRPNRAAPPRRRVNTSDSKKINTIRYPFSPYVQIQT